LGKNRGGLNTKVRLLAAGPQCAAGFTLPGGEASDAAPGRLLLDTIGRLRERGEDRRLYLLMDRAYEDGDTRLLAFELGYSPAVPPKKNRKNPWDYDKELYKQRTEVERLFRRIATRYDKLDIMFSAYIYLALALVAIISLLPVV
jgi:transposase